jgi:Cu+-exporting ATPase
MTLEPLVAAPDQAASPELRKMTQRFWIGAVLAVPVVILEMAGHLSGMALHRLISPPASMWIQFALGTPVVLWAGWPLLERGAESVRNRSLNMFSLIALGIGAAYLYSLAASFAPGLFPAALKQKDGMVPVYYEAAAVITVLVLLGQVLELRARERTGGAIRALLKLAPNTAIRIRAGGDGRRDRARAGAGR